MLLLAQHSVRVEHGVVAVRMLVAAVDMGEGG